LLACSILTTSSPFSRELPPHLSHWLSSVCLISTTFKERRRKKCSVKRRFHVSSSACKICFINFVRVTRLFFISASFLSPDVPSIYFITGRVRMDRGYRLGLPLISQVFTAKFSISSASRSLKLLQSLLFLRTAGTRLAKLQD
jgi:hypothetical protein